MIEEKIVFGLKVMRKKKKDELIFLRLKDNHYSLKSVTDCIQILNKIE